MNSVAFIAFTRKGCVLARDLADALAVDERFSNLTCTVQGPAKFAESCEIDSYGSLAEWTAGHFGKDDALVFVGATGIAVRAIAPHVADKFSDPAVVSIDEAGSFVVPLLSGHVGGANDLARVLATLAGGTAVVSTATDVNGLFAVDEWAAKRGYRIVEREVAKDISARLLEGGEVGCVSDFDLNWTAPEGVVEMVVPRADAAASASGLSGQSKRIPLGFVVSFDESFSPFGRTLHLVPREVVVGVGCRRDTPCDVLERAVDAALEQARVSRHAVKALASIDVKKDERAICELASARGWELRFYSASELNAVPGEFESSEFVRKTVGVDNVCERSAVVRGGKLLLGKQAGDGVTVALGSEVFMSQNKTAEHSGKKASGSMGKLAVIGLGPGGADDMSGRARAAIRECDLIVGYPVYVDLVRGEFPDKEVFTTPMRKEVERCRAAIEKAVEGRSVAMVCSGDPGVYGMAGLVLELAQEYPAVEIEVVPGVSASNGGAAVLGAPLMHDYCVISLSDLLTPWELIEKRLAAAAQADFVISLYNPSSHKRPDYLQKACDVLLAHKDAGTVCGTVRNIGREGEEATVLTLGELRDTQVDMFTTVFIGNSQTKVINGKMVTPRGYLQRED